LTGLQGRLPAVLNLTFL